MTSLGLSLVLLVAWTYAIAATIAVLRFARRPVAGPAERAAAEPVVSVLKPLHGAEPRLRANLRSFADQDYAAYQLILGVRDRDDTALPIARDLVRDRPDSDIQVIVDSRVSGSNLKVANVENMLPAVAGDIVVIADSDMLVTPEYLSVITQPLADPHIGAVTCLYKAVPCGGLWSHLAALNINYGFLPSAILGDAMNVGNGCFGATIALRRDVLARIGDFSRLRNELADDHRLGDAVRELGLTTVLSRYVVQNHVKERSFADLWQHELRWARTVRLMAPGGFAGSVVTHTIVLPALAAAAFGLGGPGWSLVLLSLLLRLGAALLIAERLDLPRAGLWLLPARDVLSFAVFLRSFFGRNVRWRDQVFRIEAGGRMSVERDEPA